MVPEIKYLGMHLDSKLTFKSHIKQIIKKCEISVNMLRIIAKKKWGADIITTLTFYKSRVRAIIDYGCTVYGAANKNILEILDKLQ